MPTKLLTIIIDTEELEALIDFQRSMLDGAMESLEREEVQWRTDRLNELKALLISPPSKRKHKHVGVGYCPVCKHYGWDCTGTRA
jgi:hypothetical protein